MTTIKETLRKMRTGEYSKIDLLEKILLKMVAKLRSKVPEIIRKKKKSSAPKLIHVSAFNYGNAGDALLPVAIRNAVENSEESGFKWKGIPVYKVIEQKDVNIINKSDGLIIGGGGLFLKDTNPNNLSGWQWSCSVENLKKIDVPIALVAVGYNRFRNQADFEPVFYNHINVLAEKSCFIGLRNNGSILNMKRYIREEYHHKVYFQPCPTTILSHLYPKLTEKTSQNQPFIALNCAFDRSQLRYGEKIGEKLSAIARIAKILSKDIEIKYYSHAATDNYFLPYLDSFGVPYELISLNTHPAHIVECYTKPELVIGMRGHAQMIPFGCKTPIISIISHEKMRYFIEDINHPEWGVEINDLDFEKQLLDKARYILDNKDSIKLQLNEAQNELIDVTVSNINIIKTGFKLL